MDYSRVQTILTLYSPWERAASVGATLAAATKYNPVECGFATSDWNV